MRLCYQVMDVSMPSRPFPFQPDHLIPTWMYPGRIKSLLHACNVTQSLHYRLESEKWKWVPQSTPQVFRIPACLQITTIHSTMASSYPNDHATWKPSASPSQFVILASTTTHGRISTVYHSGMADIDEEVADVKSASSRRRARVACVCCRSRKIRCDVVQRSPCTNCRLDSQICRVKPRPTK